MPQLSLGRTTHARPVRRVLAGALLGLSLVASGVAAGPAATAGHAHHRAAHHHPAAKVEHFTPRQRAVLTDPRDATHDDILAEIRKSIRSVKPKQDIRIFTWNLASPGFVNDLLDANARGVSVRVIISQGNENGDFHRLRRGLKKQSTTHPQAANNRSWARACVRSCRGPRGISHSKFYVYSQVGLAQDVVISSAANATEVAARDQWGDAYTLVGNQVVYDKFIDIFNQAAKDKTAHPGYQTVNTKTASAYFYPWRGPQARGDRVQKVLHTIACNGAAAGTGSNGHTTIRIAQDAIIDKRGIAIAKTLRSLWQDGCDLHIVFSLLGNQARDILEHTSRGPVPRRQIVSDYNGDGVYDRYLHSKVLVVSGHYGKQHDARITWQGSENWSGLAKLSDEQGLVLYGGKPVHQYTTWINGLYDNPPPSPYARSARSRVGGAAVHPYALIRSDL